MTPAIRKRLAQIGFLVLLQAVALFVPRLEVELVECLGVPGFISGLPGFQFIHPAGKTQGIGGRALAEWGRAPNAGIKSIGMITGIGGFAILILAGLDERFGWAGSIPLWIQVAAFVLLGCSYPLFTWAMVSNKFFSTVVRIQKERGHTVQTGGPYRFVRHPGYASLLVSYITIPIALGSLWACIPMIVLVANLITRTALEDRTLQNELEGYGEYALHVRYRIIPGIW